MVHKKIVVIGDGACGKTCLSVTFCKNEFPEDHIPTIYDTYCKTVLVEDRNVELAVWDTAGEEDYDRLRPLSYANASVIIVCFAIDNPISLSNVEAKWAPEVKHYCRKVPLILVGNKLDLRNNTGSVEALQTRDLHPVNYEEGMKMAKKIKARNYIECSAKHMMRVQDVFLTAAHIALEQDTVQKCCSCFK
ncbi:hypothetical protein Zmor_002777 [Zophobas morio]|uniref:Ras-like GTP-binding protein Rho1 n=1 Tax=Zophobas morio TaxID=2755281 RepID=A0AA38HLT6_9CUCU|nr:hypothetical protein Zmor_002777 [Zophobas morio]